MQRLAVVCSRDAVKLLGALWSAVLCRVVLQQRSTILEWISERSQRPSRAPEDGAARRVRFPAVMVAICTRVPVLHGIYVVRFLWTCVPNVLLAVNSVRERIQQATSDMILQPDWGLNMQIVDQVNGIHDADA